MTRRTSIMLTPATDRQITELVDFGTASDIIRIAIDRMHTQEVTMGRRRIAFDEQHVILWDGPGYYAEIPQRTPAGETQLMRLSTAHPEQECRNRGWSNPHWLNSSRPGAATSSSDGPSGINKNH